jgi:hypothetical protein
MTARRAACLALLASQALLSISVAVCAAAPGSSSADAARVAIDSCIKRLNPEIDVGYERIVSRCPDLVRRLDESGWSAWLPRDWRRADNDLSARGLRELANLLDFVSRDPVASAAGAHAPSVDHLPAVLAGLGQGGAAARNGWWARTKAWLRDVFERREEEDDDWFSRVVGQSGLSQAVIELVSYVALALVVVLAALIVLNELRVEGVLARLRHRLVTGVPGRLPLGAEAAGEGSMTWDDVQQAPAAERPRVLLELIASRLTAAGRLPHSRGLTIRELTHAARLHDEGDRDRLAHLARVSEQMRFSNDRASSEAVASALEGGRRLLQRISAGAEER